MKPPVAPSSQPVRLRGDYAGAAADYTVAQDYARYDEDEHRRWAMLLDRQLRLARTHAASAFLAGLQALCPGPRLPRLEQASEVLRRASGWELVGVPGLIPEREFFALLAGRRFPVTVWLRSPAEMDYLPEPDLFHDFFGHVPLLTDPHYARFMELYGHAGARALELGGLALLARLYWYTIEFGLIEDETGLRCFGAGILSSGGETRHALESVEPLRVRYDLDRVLRTEYLIDRYQRTYFVIRSFEELVRSAVETDFAPLYAAHTSQPPIPPGTRLTSDECVRGWPSSQCLPEADLP